MNPEACTIPATFSPSTSSETGRASCYWSSPNTPKPVVVDHTYADHASLLKFIEYNWSLQPLSATSRDNLPNPAPGPTPYIPGNSPAVGDLTTLFNF